jgi:hypothetical protein
MHRHHKLQCNKFEGILILTLIDFHSITFDFNDQTISDNDDQLILKSGSVIPIILADFGI